MVGIARRRGKIFFDDITYNFFSEITRMYKFMEIFELSVIFCIALLKRKIFAFDKGLNSTPFHNPKETPSALLTKKLTDG